MTGRDLAQADVLEAAGLSLRPLLSFRTFENPKSGSSALKEHFVLEQLYRIAREGLGRMEIEVVNVKT